MKKLTITITIILLAVIFYQNNKINKLKSDNANLEMCLEESALQLRWCEEALD